MNKQESICPIMTSALIASTGSVERSVTCSLGRCMAAVERDGRVRCGLATANPGERQAYVDDGAGAEDGEVVA